MVVMAGGVLVEVAVYRILWWFLFLLYIYIYILFSQVVYIILDEVIKK